MTSIAGRITAGIVFLMLTRCAAASTLHLNHSGWHPGGSLDVMFSGTDANADGLINMLELMTFQAVFVLPQGGATSWSMADIQPGGFEFQTTADFLLVLSNSQYTLSDSAFNGVTLGTVADAFLFPVAATTEAATLVPEPHSIALTGSALAGGVLALLRRRKQPRRRDGPFRT